MGIDIGAGFYEVFNKMEAIQHFFLDNELSVSMRLVIPTTEIYCGHFKPTFFKFSNIRNKATLFLVAK